MTDCDCSFGVADGPNGAGGPINCYALVTYIPRPLGPMLDRLRRELEPEAVAPRAHVTVLPPRPLDEGVSIADARRCLDRLLPSITPFEIVLDEVEVFDGTNVVYVSLAPRSFGALEEMHRLLHRDSLVGEERFPYHPHVTLAQNLTACQAADAKAIAAEAWRDYRGPRRFYAEAFTFVQATVTNRWVDLAEFALAPAPVGVR